MIFFIGITFLLITSVYIYVSNKEKTYFNALTFIMFIFIPANYFLPIIFHFMIEPIQCSVGYFYVYLTYLTYLVSFMIAYSFHYTLPLLEIRKITQYYYGSKLKIFTMIFFIISFLVYLPILIQFKDLLSTPREIYTATRDGFGHYYFISLLFLNIGLILSFFSFKRISLLLVMIVYLILTYLHGSKGAMIWGIMAYMLYKVYATNIKISFKTFLFIGIFFAFSMLGIFYITSLGVDNVSTLLLFMAGYSDYSRNAAMLIDNYNSYFNDYFYGLMQFQDEIYSRVPRAIFEDKPRAFGSLILAQAVFPEWFEKNVGDASFGIVGVVFADFGYFAIFYLIFSAILKGIFLRWSVDSFKKTHSIFYFIILLFAAGLGFMPLGLGYLIFEHFILAFLLIFFISLKFENNNSYILQNNQMILDFTIINKIDGLSIYAKKILENIYEYKDFSNKLFLVHKNFDDKKILNIVNFLKIKNSTLHRLSLGLLDKEFYYSPTHHGPVFNKNKILTVHDITPLILKDKSFKQYLYYRYFLGTSIQYTKKIITVSDYTKQKLLENYSLKGRENDIVVIHNATDIDKIDEVEVNNLPTKYLFFPGVHSKYKNYKRIIQAFEELNMKDLVLVITTNSDEIKEYCKNYSFVKVLSSLEYGQIKYLYLNSSGLIYPSLIEGFGFPALEAARLQIPIITTKGSSMEEFLKDGAAIYVDPYSVKDISVAIKNLLNNDLNKMINIAYANTKDLTWEENAKQVVKIIKDNCE